MIFVIHIYCAMIPKGGTARHRPLHDHLLAARHPQLGLESQQGAGACLLTNFRFDYLENNRQIMTHQNGGVGDVMKSQLQSCRPHLSYYL